MENNNLLTTPLATAWNEAQGNYSEDLANKILSFEKRQKLRFKSVLDICCGSGNLLNVMSQNYKNCYGTEVLDDFVLYNNNNHSHLKVVKTNSILDFDGIKTFDLITCTNFVLNNLTDLSIWKTFFETAYKNLNNGGVLICDFYTTKQLEDWNETIYKETDNFDQVRKVTKNSNHKSSAIINDLFYLKVNSENQNNKYKKAEINETKYAFNNELILNEIISSKFRYLIPVDANFKPIKSLNDLKIAYVIAIKREG